MVRLLVSELDHQRISQAVQAAEKATSGEIVTVIAQRSDRYSDVALWWSAGFALTILALVAALPISWLDTVKTWLFGWDITPGHHRVLAVLLGCVSAGFALVYSLLLIEPLRLWLTPKAIKSRRCRRRALDYFRVGAERRTLGGTAVLIYVSQAEHRVEIIADGAIHARVEPESWGEAALVLVDALKDNRAADGLIAAIDAVGVLLAIHFPPAVANKNELPDRLIEVGHD